MLGELPLLSHGAVQGRDTSVRDALSQGLKIQGTGDPNKNIYGYCVYSCHMFVVLLRSVYNVHNTEHIEVKRYKLDLKEVFGTLHETVVGRMPLYVSYRKTTQEYMAAVVPE